MIRPRSFTFLPLVTLASLSACISACNAGTSDDSIYGDEESSSITLGNDDDVDGSSSADEGSSTASTTDESETGIKLDVLGGDAEGMGTAGDGGDGNGCKKVDFLFIVDNSGSMLEEQDNLAASFPSFINSIQSTLADAQDYHIMVLDTDAWVYASCPLLACNGLPLPGVCVGFTCGDQPAQCEDVLGAGVTWPKGANASNIDCNFSSGLRFMDSNQPNLAGAFQCAARVGTDSTDDPERGMEAMVQALSNQNPVATCNSGFLRDDAILVVTFVTDEDDNAGDGSAGSVDVWRQALIDAKNGDDQAIVVLGLFGDDDLPNPICNGGAEVSPRLRMFLDSWGAKGVFGSICASDYDEFFQSAVDIIDTTCDEFEPPK
ncbi:hypothetical protein ACNOYE_35800 [Nannocystaceae bacterium ST9]